MKWSIRSRAYNTSWKYILIFQLCWVNIFLKDSNYSQAIRPKQYSCIFIIEITIEFSDFMYFFTQFTFSLFENTLPKRYTRLKRENFIYLRRRCVYVSKNIFIYFRLLAWIFVEFYSLINLEYSENPYLINILFNK